MLFTSLTSKYKTTQYIEQLLFFILRYVTKNYILCSELPSLYNWFDETKSVELKNSTYSINPELAWGNNIPKNIVISRSHNKINLNKFFRKMTGLIPNQNISEKIKKLKIAFIGFGGMSQNVLHNLFEFGYLNGENIFIYENDNMDILNHFRCPFSNFGPPRTFTNKFNPKLNYVPEKWGIEINNLFPCEIDDSNIEVLNNYDYIIGAVPPNLTDTLRSLYKNKFISIQHFNNVGRISTKTIKRSGLGVETYGSIELMTLFGNMFTLTHKLATLISQGIPEEYEYEVNFYEDYISKLQLVKKHERLNLYEFNNLQFMVIK